MEHYDQPEVDALLARRSRSQMLWLAAVLLVGFALAATFLNWGKSAPHEPDGRQQSKKAEEPNLPDEPAFELDPAERKQVADRLARMGKQLGLAAPAAERDASLTAALDQLDRKLDEKLSDKKPARKPGPLREYGPVRRQLRALSWKHGVEGYDSRHLGAADLIQRLQEKLIERGVLQKDAGE